MYNVLKVKLLLNKLNFYNSLLSGFLKEQLRIIKRKKNIFYKSLLFMILGKISYFHIMAGFYWHIHNLIFLLIHDIIISSEIFKIIIGLQIFTHKIIYKKEN